MVTGSPVGISASGNCDDVIAVDVRGEGVDLVHSTVVFTCVNKTNESNALATTAQGNGKCVFFINNTEDTENRGNYGYYDFSSLKNKRAIMKCCKTYDSSTIFPSFC